MASFLHTMVRITDPEASRRFYEALGFSFSRDMDIVRNGEVEATNYFYSLGDDENVLELTFNRDGRTYELGTGYGHIALAWTTWTRRSSNWPARASRRSASRTASARAGRGCASLTIRTVTGLSSSTEAANSRASVDSGD